MTRIQIIVLCLTIIAVLTGLIATFWVFPIYGFAGIFLLWFAIATPYLVWLLIMAAIHSIQERTCPNCKGKLEFTRLNKKGDFEDLTDEEMRFLKQNPRAVIVFELARCRRCPFHEERKKTLWTSNNDFFAND